MPRCPYRPQDRPGRTPDVRAAHRARGALQALHRPLRGIAPGRDVPAGALADARRRLSATAEPGMARARRPSLPTSGAQGARTTRSQGRIRVGSGSNLMASRCAAVSYTHLTLPTNREV